MALFVDRQSQYPNRRRLKNVSTNEETIYDVFREEGEITNPGTSWNATTFNNLFDEVIKFTPEIYSSKQRGKALNTKGGNSAGYFCRSANIFVLQIYIHYVEIIEVDHSPGAFYEVKVTRDDGKSFLQNLNIPYKVGASCCAAYMKKQGTNWDNLFESYPVSLMITPTRTDNDHNDHIDYLQLYKGPDNVPIQTMTTNNEAIPYPVVLYCSIPFITSPI